MIYLNAENPSAIGDDTFWTWFAREFQGSTFGLPKQLEKEDIVIQYSTLGFPMAGKSVALLLELYPEMKEVFKTDVWDHRIEKVYETAKFCTYRMVPTMETAKWYKQYGSVDVIPIGVDPILFRPQYNQEGLRERYGFPQDVKIGFWCGTTHQMKGFDLLKQYAAAHPEIYWIVVWKWEHEAGYLDGARNFIGVSQEMLADLMNCADFFLSTGRLKSYYMVEWEAMACNLPFVNLTDREFTPQPRPRDDVIEREWDRPAVKRLWTKYLQERYISW